MNDHLRRFRRSLRSELGYMRDQMAGLAEQDSAQRFQIRQIGKATLAAVGAWYLAERMLATQTVWIAPATAVIMVHGTVYRTLTAGLRRVSAVTAGVILAGSIGHLLGLNAVSLLLVVPPALIAARWHRMGRHGPDVATTAVLMLSYGAASQDRYLLGYVLATAVGAVVGALVNTLLWPPLYRRRTHTAVWRLAKEAADLLSRVAAALRDNCDLSGLTEWQNHAAQLDSHLARAASAIAEGAESRRYNIRQFSGPGLRDPAPAVRALEEIGVHIHAIIRALDHTDRRARGHDDTKNLSISPEFGRDYADLLDLLADIIATHIYRPDDSTEINSPLAKALERAVAIGEQMTDEVRAGDLDHPRGWETSGSLLTDAQCILTILTSLTNPPEPTTTTSTAPAPTAA